MGSAVSSGSAGSGGPERIADYLSGMARDLTHGGRRRGRPPGKRKKHVREQGLVPSSLAPGDRPKRCKACRADALAKELKYGYCARCWAG
jgi:hypothetical protein